MDNDTQEETQELTETPKQSKQIKKMRDLTLKQRRWLEEYIKTGNATEAAMQAYQVTSRGSAGQIGWENLKKLEGSELMESMGLTKRNVVQMLAVGLTRANKKVEKRTIKRKYDDRDEIETEYEDVPDYATRHKYIETALKLNKMIGDNMQEIDIGEINIFWGNPQENDENIIDAQIVPENEAQNDSQTGVEVKSDSTTHE